MPSDNDQSIPRIPATLEAVEARLHVMVEKIYNDVPTGWQAAVFVFNTESCQALHASTANPDILIQMMNGFIESYNNGTHKDMT